MSYRSTTIPDSALRDALALNALKIKQLESRSRWPGAVQQANPGLLVPVVSTPGLTVASPPNFGFPTFTTIASLLLSPGGWVLKSGATAAVAGLVSRGEMIVVMRLTSSLSVLPLRIVARQMVGTSSGNPSATFGLTLPARLIADRDVEVDLEMGFAYVGGASGSLTCAASSIHLTAVPT